MKTFLRKIGSSFYILTIGGIVLCSNFIEKIDQGIHTPKEAQTYSGLFTVVHADFSGNDSSNTSDSGSSGSAGCGSSGDSSCSDGSSSSD